MSVAVLTQNLPKILADFSEISLVYLFGSQVSGEIGPMSDYDLAILVESPVAEGEIRDRFQHEVVCTLGTDRVDVVLLDKAPIDLSYNIITTGKILYQRDTYSRVEYEANVLGRYGDYIPVKRFFETQTLQGDEHAKRARQYRKAFERFRRSGTLF